MYTNTGYHSQITGPDGYSKICHCGKRHGYPHTGPRDLDIEWCGCSRNRPVRERRAGDNLGKKTSHTVKRATTISPANY